MQPVLRRGLFALGLVWAFQVLGAPAQMPVELRFKPPATVETGEVQLGNIAIVDTENDRLRRQMIRMPLGIGLHAGQRRSITRDQVAARILSDYPELHGRLLWKGAHAVSVTRRGRLIPPERISRAATRFLERRLARDFVDYRATPVGKLPRIYGGSDDVRLRPHLRVSQVRQRMAVWVDIEEAGHRRSVPVWFRVSARAEVLTASRDLAPGSPVTRGDFETSLMDVAKLSSQPWPPGQPIRFMRTVVPVHSGQALTRRQLTRIPPVTADNPVTVHVARGAVRLKLTGISRQNGRIGDRVRIVNPGSGRSFEAVVVARDEVAVGTKSEL